MNHKKVSTAQYGDEKMKKFDQETPEVHYINNLLLEKRCRGLLLYLESILPKHIKFYIVGGSIRDAIINFHFSKITIPNDIDIVVDCLSIDKHIKYFPGIIERTPLGGYRWKHPTSQYYVDLWTLSSTFFIANNQIKPSIENYLLGSDFNINKISYDYRCKVLIDAGAIKGIKDKTIRYTPKWPQGNKLHYHAARAINLKNKTKFNIDRSVIEMIFRSNWESRIEQIILYLSENKLSSLKIKSLFLELYKINLEHYKDEYA